MAFHDNMAPSPNRKSSKRKDEGDDESPKRAKHSKANETRQSKRQMDDNYDEYFGREKDSRSKPSRSPIQGACSINYNRSKSRSKDHEDHHRSKFSPERPYSQEHSHEKRWHDQDASSTLYRSGSGTGRSDTTDCRGTHTARANKDPTRARSPTSTQKYNEAYSKPLPPGAKGNFFRCS